MVELTKEQQEFLLECEEEFKDRFTEKDEEFMKVKFGEPKKPPIVDPWCNARQSSRATFSHQNRRRSKRKRDRDSDRGRRDRDRDRLRKSEKRPSGDSLPNGQQSSKRQRQRRDRRIRARDSDRRRVSRHRDRFGELQKLPIVNPFSPSQDYSRDINNRDKDCDRAKGDIRDKDRLGELDKPPIVDPYLCNTQQNFKNNSSHQDDAPDISNRDMDSDRESEDKHKEKLGRSDQLPILHPHLYNRPPSSENISSLQHCGGNTSNRDSRDKRSDRERGDRERNRLEESDQPPIVNLDLCNTQQSSRNNSLLQDEGSDITNRDMVSDRERGDKHKKKLGGSAQPPILNPYLYNRPSSSGNISSLQHCGGNTSNRDSRDKRSDRERKDIVQPPVVDPYCYNRHRSSRNYCLHEYCGRGRRNPGRDSNRGRGYRYRDREDRYIESRRGGKDHHQYYRPY